MDLSALLNELVTRSGTLKVWFEFDVPATSTPPVTPPPVEPPPVMKYYESHGIHGEHFSVEQSTGKVGEPFWFNFTVANFLNEQVNFSILAAKCEEGPRAMSWTNSHLDANQTLVWRDNLKFTAPGTYHIYLGVGYGDLQQLKDGILPWDRLSDSITIVIQ